MKNILIICDDINIKFGIFRLKKKGGSGGHNGLKSIQNEIGTNKYARFRFGIGNEYNKNMEKYVLSNWNKNEMNFLSLKSDLIIKIILYFITEGIEKTMNLFNNKEYTL